MSASTYPSHKGTLDGAPPEPSYHTPRVSQSSTSSGQSLNPSLPPTPCSANSALKSQVTELERIKESLIRQAADAEARTVVAKTRASEAEKRAIAAELETTAAKRRAQNRYTEKLHANNESRKLREALQAEEAHSHGFLVRLQKRLSSLDARIKQLETEKMVGDWTSERDAKIDMLEGQLGEMQRGFVASQEEKTTNKAQSDKLIHGLQKVIIRLQSSLTAEQARKNTTLDDLQAQIHLAKTEAIKDMMKKFEGRINESEMKFKFREQELVHNTRMKLRDTEFHRSQEVQSLAKKLALLEHQLQDVKKQIEKCKHQLQIAVQIIQGSPQRFGVQQHQQISQQALHFNKRKRVDSTSSADSSTYCIASNQAAVTPRPLEDFNGDIAMSNAQSFSQQSTGVQNMISVNTGHQLASQAWIQDLIQNAQPLHSVFNMGVAQQSYNGVRVPSNTPISTPHAQHNNGGRFTPTVGKTDMISDSGSNEFMDNLGMPGPVGSYGYAADDWMSFEDTQAATLHDSLPNGNPMPQMNANQSHINQNPARSNSNRACQQSNLNRESQASWRSTPAPQGTCTPRTPAPAEPGKLCCVNCYQHWWELDCDGGEPCSNCKAQGKPCKHQRCFNFAAGTCDKGDKCPCVHEGDELYHDDFLVHQPKPGKRPTRVGKKTDAAVAPILRKRC